MNKKVLLVEDDMITAMAEAIMLKKNLLEVTIANSGEKAIEYISQPEQNFDLILMDIDLGPGISGTQTAESILKITDIPIIFLTSHCEKEMVDKVRNITRYGYVIKNSGDFVLLSSIEMAFELFESNKKIRASEEYNKILFQKSKTPLVVMDIEDYHFIDCNEAAVEIYGCKSKEEVINKNPLSVSAEFQYDGRTSKEAAKEYIDLALKEGSAKFEWRHLRSNGEIWDAEVQLMSFAYGNRKMIQFSLLDITKRKEAEKILLDKIKLEERIAKIVATAPGALYTFCLKPDGTSYFPYVSPAWETIVGTSYVEATNEGFSLKNIIHPDDIESFEKSIIESAQKLLPWHLVFRINNDRRGLLWIEGNSIPSRQSDKSILWHGFITDITDHIQTEEKLRDSEERYRNLVDLIPDGIIIHTDSKVVFANRSAVSIFKAKNQDNLIGKNILDLVAPEYKNMVIERVKNSLYLGINAEPIKELFQTLDGDIINVEVAAIPFTYMGKQSMLVVFSNITEKTKIEGKLKESENLFFKFMDHLPVCTFIKDSEGKTIFSNTFMDKEFNSNSWEGKKAKEIFPETIAEKIIQDDLTALEKGYMINIENLTTVDGQTHIYETHKFSIPRENGEPLLGGIAIDITERITVEKTLQTTLNTLEDIIKSIPSGLFIYQYEEPDKLYLLKANEAATKITGISETEWINREFNEIWPNAVKFGITQSYLDVIYSGKNIELEDINYEDDRINGAYRIRAFNIPGKKLGVAFEDVTKTKIAEAAWHESEKIFAEFMKNSPIYVFFKDANIRAMRLSDNFEKMLGRPLNEIIGKDMNELFPSTLAKSMIEDDKKILNGGETITINEELNGRYYTTIKFPIIFDNKPKYLAGYTIDITDMKNAEEERIKMLQQLQDTQRIEALGILAGGIAHDFNNLLVGIFGYMDMARADSTEPRIRDMIDSAMTTIERARNLTKQLLTFAKGGAPITLTEPLVDFIRESTKFALSGSNINCKFDIQSDLWMSNYDHNQLSQVMDNLIINAQQAMPVGGTIFVSAKNIILQENEHINLPAGNYVLITVTDNGTGIPPEILPRIFDPFFTTKQKGSGLGLAISYSIIKKHGGLIEAKSEPGHGTTFSIYLPAVDKKIEPETIPQSVARAGSGNILFMDDEDVIRDSVSKILEYVGYSVTAVSTGEEVISNFKKSIESNILFKAIIMDLTVNNGMGGKETIGTLREIDPEIPIFVSSGYSDDPVMSDPQKYGFTDSIQKPFRMSELNGILLKYFK